MTRKTLVLNGRQISLEDGSVGGRDHPSAAALHLGIAGVGEYVELTLTQATAADLVAELAHFQHHGRLRPEPAAAAPLPVEGEPEAQP